MPGTKTAVKSETKEEPKVLADQKLGKLLKDYTAKEIDTASYWLKIVEYVSKVNITRTTLIETLVQFRGVKKSTASVEATFIMQGAKPENAELLQQALDKEIPVREFRKAIMGTGKSDEEGNKEIDYEKRIKAKLKPAATYAVENVEITVKDFKGFAGEVFEKALAKQEAKESGEATEDDEDKEPDEGELVGAGVEE
jgi:hypothetical protein